MSVNGEGLRVALVCPYSLDTPGGVATHVLGLARWLAVQGHRPVVIAPGTKPPDDGVPVRLLGPAVGLRFNGSVAELALCPSQVRAALAAAADADVVHVHEPLTPGVGHTVASRSRRLVVTHHASFDARPWRPVLRLLSRSVRPVARIAVSEAAAATARVATGEQAVIVPNAITIPAAPERGAGARSRVVFVGRLDEPRKGYGVFQAIARAIPAAEFVAVGPGSGGAGDVLELGRLDDAGLAGVLSSAAVVVAPNLYGESFGMVLVEALAHGAAVVASDLPAFRHVVDDPAVISWFPAGDEVAGAEAVRWRLTHPADPQRAWREAARYGWDTVGPRVLAAYRLP